MGGGGRAGRHPRSQGSVSGLRDGRMRRVFDHPAIHPQFRGKPWRGNPLFLWCGADLAERGDTRHLAAHAARRIPRRMPRKAQRSEEHTSELQSLMRISYAVFCLKKKKYTYNKHQTTQTNTKQDT